MLPAANGSRRLSSWPNRPMATCLPVSAKDTGAMSTVSERLRKPGQSKLHARFEFTCMYVCLLCCACVFCFLLVFFSFVVRLASTNTPRLHDMLLYVTIRPCFGNAKLDIYLVRFIHERANSLLSTQQVNPVCASINLYAKSSRSFSVSFRFMTMMRKRAGRHWTA